MSSGNRSLPCTPNRSQYAEQRSRLVKSLKTALDGWKSDLKTGMTSIDAICELRRAALAAAEEKEATTDTRLEENLKMDEACTQLSAVCDSLAVRVNSMSSVSERLDSLSALEPDNGDTSRLSKAASSIKDCYSKQRDVARAVAENVATCDSENALTFHSCAWIHEPYINDHCLACEVIVDHFANQ